MSDQNRETLGFQAEVKQLLHLMIHSLYSNKEIFLRELISNASDAADKLRFEALADSSLFEQDPDLKIHIDFDKDSKTLSITDNGIGMSRTEVVDQLGTIAKSGTAEFLSRLSGDQQKDSQLIGQFGVGFYSAFIVAKKVEVFSRRAGKNPADGVHWSSNGEGEFEVATVELPARGTRVVLHLKSDEMEFLDPYRLRALIRKYSDHISIPVEMPTIEGDDKTEGFEVVNSAKALWTRSRSEIKDDEYQEFYKHISHDFRDALIWSHNTVEGKREYTSLLYIPSAAPFDLWHREGARGLKLYIQRVFIMDDAEQFLPLYLRFVKGIVDSNDLPLNVSRELLQSDESVEAMRSALSKRVLDMLGKLAKEDKEKYATFWREFGRVLKEGPAEDQGNSERIAKLLRFTTTVSEKDSQDVSLEDYVGRMPETQKEIFYITGDSYQNALASPHLEVFARKNYEVLVLHDSIDEWLMAHLHEYQGKALRDISKGELDLDGESEGPTDTQTAETEPKMQELIDAIKSVLGERVEGVRVSTRLTDSPACLVLGADELGQQMRMIMEAAGQSVPVSKPYMEINPDNPLVTRMAERPQGERFEDLTWILFDQATLAQGQQLEDPSAYVKRMNRLLVEL